MSRRSGSPFSERKGFELAWVRLDDNFHWHPKVTPLSDGAYRLYVGALCYCNRYQQGGRVTSTHIKTLVGTGRRVQRMVTELVLATLWVEDGPDWLIHDYLLYQPDPTKQAAGRAGGQASAQARAQADRKHGAQAPAQPPSRTRPVPVGVITPEVPLQDDCSIESRGWRGEEEDIAVVLQRFKAPSVVVS